MAGNEKMGGDGSIGVYRCSWMECLPGLPHEWWACAGFLRTGDWGRWGKFLRSRCLSRLGFPWVVRGRGLSSARPCDEGLRFADGYWFW